MNDTFLGVLFGGDQWKSFREVETHLVNKNTARTRSVRSLLSFRVLKYDAGADDIVAWAQFS